MKRLEKDSPYPKIIYKYSRIDEYLYQLLANKELWFSNPTDFNDPYDCNICFDDRTYSIDEIRAFWNADFNKTILTTEEKEKRIGEWHNDQSLIGKFLIPAMKKRLETWAVTCFASKNNNLLMWSHYANSHQGICIGFDSESLKNTFFQHEWVTYDHTFPKVSLLDINNFISTIGVFKSKEWEYEDEIRFFQKERAAYPFRKEAIKEIIFGLRTPISHMKTVMNLMDQLNYQSVLYKQVILMDNQFKIQFANLKYVPKMDRVFKVHQANGKMHFKVLRGWLQSG